MNGITSQGIIDDAMRCKNLLYNGTFPVHVFPKQIQHIITETHECLNFPVDYIALSLCYAVSVCMGNLFTAKVKEGWHERAILYIALIGKTGSNKSHPLSFAMQPLFNHDNNMNVRYKQECSEYERIMMLSRKEREEHGTTEVAQEPVRKKFIVSDITPECLAFIHDNNKRGIGLYTDELSSWFKNFNRYTKGSEEQFWLSVFSGKPIILDRKGMKYSTFIKHSFISVIGSIQQGILKELAKGERSQNGFLDRILFVLPDNLDKQYWNEKQLDFRIAAHWEQIVNKLIEVEFSVDDNECPIPKELAFDSIAKQHIAEWQRQNTDLCNTINDESLAGIYSKLEIYAIRFCLILQVMRWICNEAGRDGIDETSVTGAIELVEYFRGTAQKVQAIINETFALEGLPSNNLKLFKALPLDFETGQGIEIAAKFDMSPDAFKRFLRDHKGSLFDNYKHGKYRKKIQS